MEIEIKYTVDNDNWSDEEYQEKCERKIIIDESKISDILDQLVALEKDEFLDVIISLKEINPNYGN